MSAPYRAPTIALVSASKDFRPGNRATTFSIVVGALSSAGLERLPYKQEVTGSNPVVPIFPPSGVRYMRLFILSLMVLLSGCYRSGVEAVREPLHRPPSVTVSSTGMDVNLAPEREVVTEVIQATPAEAWAALKTVYEEFDIEVKEGNEDLMILGNPKFVRSRRLGRTRLSTYLDCGAGPTGDHADSHRVEIQIRSSILQVPAGVRVNTHLAAIARNMDGTSNNRIRCASKFRLEQEIAGRVKFWAEGGSRPPPASKLNGVVR